MPEDKLVDELEELAEQPAGNDIVYIVDVSEPIDEDKDKYIEIDNLLAGTVSDHGGLTGLADDDHAQYHNDTRGDARYFTRNLATKTTAYTITASDHTIICNATSGAFTITLPAAASHTGRIYHIKKIDSSGNAVTVDGNSSETIDDGTTAVLTVQYETISIQSDGAEWWIL
jgi:hypothetical protein